MLPAIRIDASPRERRAQYRQVGASIRSLLAKEPDWIAAMATVAGELHHSFDYFHWTGFYRAVSERLLVVGPHQGGHACLRIDFSRGVCGAAARSRKTQRIDDVHSFSGHIACSSASRSEIVVPVISPAQRLLAVLDVDSDHPAAFVADDEDELEAICRWLGERYGETEVL